MKGIDSISLFSTLLLRDTLPELDDTNGREFCLFPGSSTPDTTGIFDLFRVFPQKWVSETFLGRGYGGTKIVKLWVKPKHWRSWHSIR